MAYSEYVPARKHNANLVRLNSFDSRATRDCFSRTALTDSTIENEAGSQVVEAYRLLDHIQATGCRSHVSSALSIDCESYQGTLNGMY